jgi:hypothetical protein
MLDGLNLEVKSYFEMAIVAGIVGANCIYKYIIGNISF